jgi:hypothetical protein
MLGCISLFIKTIPFCIILSRAVKPNISSAMVLFMPLLARSSLADPLVKLLLLKKQPIF